MIATSLRRIVVHWAMAAIAALGPGFAGASAASSEAMAADSKDRPEDARLIPRGGNEYCLVRTVPNGAGGNVTLKLPVIGVSDRDHWQTSKSIVLKKPEVPHLSHCRPQVSIQNGDELDIVKRGTSKYAVRLVRNKHDTLLSRIFKKAGGDSYLVATDEDCTTGGRDCDEFDGYDVYLYMADEPRNPRDNAKIAFIDFFPAENGDTPCDEERPDKAMKPRTGDYRVCPLPWGPGMFPLGMPLSEDKQLGTGGGYEPP